MSITTCLATSHYGIACRLISRVRFPTIPNTSLRGEIMSRVKNPYGEVTVNLDFQRRQGIYEFGDGLDEKGSGYEVITSYNPVVDMWNYRILVDGHEDYVSTPRHLSEDTALLSAQDKISEMCEQD